MQISLKLDLFGANEVDIWNQRPRLRRNRLILVENAGGFCRPVLKYSFTFEKLYNLTLHHMLIPLIEFCIEMLLSDLYH